MKKSMAKDSITISEALQKIHEWMDEKNYEKIIQGALGDSIGYHCRPGGHALIAADFWHYLDFADRHGGRR